MALPSSTRNRVLDCAGKRLDLAHTAVMGVLNVTPDSFSDGGFYLAPQRALSRAREMAAEGAALIDIGGESTRPGATPVSVQEELDRVVPLVEILARELPIPVSVDTSKPEVIKEALRAGAGMINDVRALQAPGALEALTRYSVPVCLMHMQGSPAIMQLNPRYDHIIGDIKGFLASRIQICLAAGIERERIIVDPGFGFGKSVSHNLSLLRRLAEFHTLGAPLLIGMSRKSTLGKILDAPVQERLYGSLAAAVIAAWQGAHIIRAHDVGPTVQALRVCTAVLQAD